jgi:hypothetical protein
MYQLNKLSENVLKATRGTWESELEDANDSFSTIGYQMTLDSAELRLTSKPDMVTTYCLVPTSGSTESAVALIELVHVLPGHDESYMKLMSIRMTPRLDTRMSNTAANNRFTRHNEIALIASTAITSVLSKAVDMELSMLKVFTTPQADVVLLMSISKLMNNERLHNHGIDVDSHNNWVQFKIK